MRITIELDETEIDVLKTGKPAVPSYGSTATVDPRAIMRIAHDLVKLPEAKRLSAIISGEFRGCATHIREDSDPYKWAITLTGVLTSLKE